MAYLFNIFSIIDIKISTRTTMVSALDFDFIDMHNVVRSPVIITTNVIYDNECQTLQ